MLCKYKSCVTQNINKKESNITVITGKVHNCEERNEKLVRLGGESEKEEKTNKKYRCINTKKEKQKDKRKCTKTRCRDTLQ